VKKAKIYTFENGNMAGHEWRWTFTLEHMPDATFTLSAKQKLINRDRGDEPFDIDPASSLTDGAAIYEAFYEMLSDPFVDADPETLDYEEVALEISRIDLNASKEFIAAAKLEEDEEENETLPGGLIVRSGRLTKREESEAYAILAGGPKVMMRARRYSPGQLAELAAKAAQPEPDSAAPGDASRDTPPAGG